MKLLFLCHSLNVGGIETYLLRFTKWMKQHHSEHELHLVCKSGVFGTYESDFQINRVVLHAFPMGYFNLLHIYSFCKFLQHHRFDAVCDFSGDFGAQAVTAAFFVRVPVRVVFYRAATNVYKLSKLKSFYQRILNRIVFKLSTKLLSNSKRAFDNFYYYFDFNNDSKFKIISNGIPLPVFLSKEKKQKLLKELNLSNNQKIILHVGNSGYIKNHNCMLEIAIISQNNNDDFLFFFVGPNVESSYGEFVKKQNLKNVRFLGVRRDVDSLMQLANIFLFPSISEGQPNALLEAIINELPFVASDIAVIRETLPSDWGNKWLFPPDRPYEGYSLLKEHFRNDFKTDPQFRLLVEWSKNQYNVDRCFNTFYKCLNC